MRAARPYERSVTRIAAGLFLVFAGCVTLRGRQDRDVVFTQYSPLSRIAEVARRTMPPVAYHQMEHALSEAHRKLAEQAIDLAREKFDVYVPAAPPGPEGYGLVVYISPSSGPLQLRDWSEALDGHRLILVSAQGSGNEMSSLDRRVPLALLGYENIRARFPIDSKRVYVMGFSGGARVAEIVALAYPDVFQGAVLNAGSDPIDGKDGNYKPPAALFHAFQRSRLVFITGEEDVDHLRRDEVSQDSLRAGCVLDVKTEILPRVGHHSIDGFALDRVLDALTARRAMDSDELDRCNERLAGELAAALAGVDAAIGRGDSAAAAAQIQTVDARFGGLAAPRILDLEARLAAPR